MRRRLLSMALAGAACSGPSGDDATNATGIDPSAGPATDDIESLDDRLDLGDDPGEFPGLEPLGPVVLADPPPPPISGGTLRWSHDRATLLVADPDRDAVYVVDPAAQQVLHAIELEPGSEPGRIAEDPSSGLIHVALRRSGEVATIDVASGELVATRFACANPRGIAVDPGDDSVLVACAEGVLARLRPDDSLERLEVGVELRDVIDPGPPIRVSTFRDARVLTLDDTGAITADRAPPEVGVRFDHFLDPDDPDVAGLELDDVMTPNTARRTWATADGGWLMLHQAGSSIARSAMIEGGYAGDGVCIPMQTTVITRGLPGGASTKASPLHHIAPAFDADVTDELDRVAVVGGVLGSWVIMFASSELQPRTVLPPPCRAGDTYDLPGEPTSVVFDDEGQAWVQLREPAALVRVDPQARALVANIALAERSVLDTGHELFHRPTLGLVACVSCHPEGREDGRVWQFSDLGPRRTQALDAGLEGTEPFHWRGELADIAAIVEDTFRGRMNGRLLPEEHVAALERWLFALPSLRVAAPQDTRAVERGREHFEAAGCSSCHSGSRLTHNGTVMLGSYGMLQVPSLLGVAFRAPYMHDGRATDLDAAVADMLGLTAPGVHLSAEERTELVAYLASLAVE